MCKGVERLDDVTGLGCLDDVTGVGQSGGALGGSSTCPWALVLSRVRPGPAVMGRGP
jgi:hypothetical protein